MHTMRDEHFGISVVEFMAAGAVARASSPHILTRRDGETERGRDGWLGGWMGG